MMAQYTSAGELQLAEAAEDSPKVTTGISLIFAMIWAFRTSWLGIGVGIIAVFKWPHKK